MDKMSITQTAELIEKVKTAIFLTGAGMSADSGIPTYHDEDGFWKNFSSYAKLKINPIELATPYAFATTPQLAWGLIEWKRRKISENRSHDGYAFINNWIEKIFHMRLFTLLILMDIMRFLVVIKILSGVYSVRVNAKQQ